MKRILLAASLFALAVPAVLRADEPTLAAQSTLHANLTGPRHFSETGGKALYEAVCASCHMPDGRGGAGAGRYPALAHNPNLATAAYPAMMIMNGRGAMPSFATQMTDAQVVAVVGYIRTNLGNSYKDGLTAAEVKALRAP